MVRLAYLLFTRLTSLISLGPPRLESSASLEKMKIYPGATALNFIFGALLLLYLPLQIRARNIGLSFFILWVSALCIAYGANTVVWRDNALNSAPIWCEICVFAFFLLPIWDVPLYVGLMVLFPVIRAIMGGLVAAASCSLSIVRQLHRTVSPRRVVMSQKQVRALCTT